MRYKHLLIMAVVAVVAAVGCKKKSSNNAKPISSYSFTDSGNMYTFNTISFKSTAPKGCTYIWKFGDGATSNDSFPAHTYYNADSFAVTLIVNNDSAHATHSVVYISSTTQRMSGSYVHCKEGGKVQSAKWPIDFAGISYTIDPSSVTFGISINNEASITVADSFSHVYNVTKVLNRNDAIGTDHTVTFSNTTSTEYFTYDFVGDHIYYGLVDTSTPGIYSIDAFKIK